MRFKVHASTAEGLCRSCSRAHYRKDVRGRELLLCRATGDVPHRILTPIVECRDYEKHGEPPLWELRQIAWTLCSDKKGNLIGFKRAQEADRLIEEGKAAALPPVPGLD